MKLRLLFAFMFVFGIIPHVMASPDDMEVSTWDTPVCEHTMTTNHFELAPGESVEIHLNLTECTEAYEGMLFFGYNTTDNSSRQLTTRDNIRLTVVGTNSSLSLDQNTANEWEWTSDSGYLYVSTSNPTAYASGSNPTGFIIYAENMNKKKSLTIRLRASAIW